MNTNSGALIVPAPAPSGTNAAATNELHDIKGPVHIPAAWTWLWWTLGAILVCLAVFAAVRYWLSRRAKARPPEIVIPPHVRARRRLREAEQWFNQPRPFCILVSDTLRVYLEERFELRAPERTTEEFLVELQSSPVLSPDQKQSLRDFLERCDLVKFARYEPREPELRDLLEAALRLVDETAPPDAPAPGTVTPSSAVETAGRTSP